MRLISVFLISISLALAASAGADTIIFADGTFIEGNVTRETTRTLTVSTRFGLRSYDRGDVAEIIKDVATLELDAVADFDKLQPVIKSVLNAQADYDLGHYERALHCLEPYRDNKQDRAESIRIDWLLIEISERQGRWVDARRMLEDKRRTGTPRERIRAKAHLDLFDDNPDFDLRYIGEKHARNVLKRPSLLARARKKGALADRELMRLGLEEMCEQLLVQDVHGIKSFAAKLDPEATYQSCRNLPGTGDIGRNLPYKDNLRQAEATLAKAQAILGDYGRAFELDLIRTELTHLLTVFNRMWREVLSASPESFRPSSDSKTGRLTADGRREWQRRCDEFLDLAQPVTRLLEYMVDKVDQYPQGLRDLRALLLDYDERFEHMVKTIKKARGRTRV